MPAEFVTSRDVATIAPDWVRPFAVSRATFTAWIPPAAISVLVELEVVYVTSPAAFAMAILCTSLDVLSNTTSPATLVTVRLGAINAPDWVMPPACKTIGLPSVSRRTISMSFASTMLSEESAITSIF